MTDADNGGDFAEALAPVYTDHEMTRILATVRWKPDICYNVIARQIERVAFLYRPYRALLDDHRRPSVRERRLSGALKKLRAGDITGVENLSQTDRAYLEWAGSDLAKFDGALPDVEPEMERLPCRPGRDETEFMMIWDSSRQIDICLDRRVHINWLKRCVERAIELTTGEKKTHGSKVADEALHDTIKLFNDIYRDHAADPRAPGIDIGDDSAQRQMWRKSELLDFLDAALRPLGIRKTREAICHQWRDATPHWRGAAQRAAEEKK